MKPVEKVAKPCEWCHEAFLSFPSQVHRRRFCSQRCHNEWMSAHPEGMNRFQTQRTCEICHQVFLAKDKRGRWCHSCVDPTNALAQSLARFYGITIVQYEALVVAQEGRCKICRCQPTGSRNFKRLHIDHNHETGEVRGLLCPRCNVAVGFVESHGNIEEVVAYLRCAPSQLRLVG